MNSHIFGVYTKIKSSDSKSRTYTHNFNLSEYAESEHYYNNLKIGNSSIQVVYFQNESLLVIEYSFGGSIETYFYIIPNEKRGLSKGEELNISLLKYIDKSMYDNPELERGENYFVWENEVIEEILKIKFSD